MLPQGSPPGRPKKIRRLFIFGILLGSFAFFISLLYFRSWLYRPNYAASLQEGYDLSVAGTRGMNPAGMWPHFTMDIRINASGLNSAQVMWRMIEGKEEKVSVGTITTTGLTSSHKTWLPLEWRNAKIDQTKTSLLWLSREAYSELKSTGKTRWVTNWGIPWLPFEFLAVHLFGGGMETTLNLADDHVMYPVWGTGGKTYFPSLFAKDGLTNRYWIKDDINNPLILKFIPSRFTLGIMLIDGFLFWTPIRYAANYRYEVIAAK